MIKRTFSTASNILSKLRLPIIQSPMFIVSGPELVIASCNAGIVGTFPALNPRTDKELDQWLTEIKQKIPKEYPYGVNLIVHKSNKRLGAVKDLVDQVHSYGGVVYHDVTNLRHAIKAKEAGVDGLIAVCAGAGGHAGVISPFALVPQLRKELGGVIICAGAISTGGGIRAAKALGADFAYMGTRFIATKESRAVDQYKQMCVDSKIGPSPSFLPVVYTDKISGVNANFLRKSLENNGLDPDNLKGEAGEEDFSKLSICNFNIAAEGKTNSGNAWADVWSAGQGVLNIDTVPSVEELVSVLQEEYNKA